MTGFDSWMIWPEHAALSVLALLLFALPLLYVARKPMHGFIRSLSRAAAHPLRLAARWALSTAVMLRERNRAVLLAHGREEVGQRVEREFERIGLLVRRDLDGYPALQRKLMDEITRIEEDFRKCGEVPPAAPDWVGVLGAVSKIKSSGNEMVQRILEEIKRSVEKIHDQALGEYRSAYESRHKILKGFMPFWRSVETTLTRVDRKLTGLEQSAQSIDAQMDKYAEINAGSQKAEEALTTSAFVQFTIASLVMAIALGGAFINFKLIALPMSEMVGAADYITNHLRTSEVAALVIIFLEASMGLFLMEALRVTHLFPRIANMEERMRRRMFWAALSFLVILAGIEAALALMRDMLIADKQALLQSLAAGQIQAHAANGWLARIPTAGQMILGFVLPFVLAFVAIPLEMFIHSLRHVAGAMLVFALRVLAFVLSLGASVARQFGALATMLYDLLIFAPLWIERQIQTFRGVSDAGRSEIKPFYRRGAVRGAETTR